MLKLLALYGISNQSTFIIFDKLSLLLLLWSLSATTECGKGMNMHYLKLTYPLRSFYFNLLFKITVTDITWINSEVKTEFFFCEIRIPFCLIFAFHSLSRTSHTQTQKLWECRVSNLGRLGEKHNVYLCAIPPLEIQIGSNSILMTKVWPAVKWSRNLNSYFQNTLAFYLEWPLIAEPLGNETVTYLVY